MSDWIACGNQFVQILADAFSDMDLPGFLFDQLNDVLLLDSVLLIGVLFQNIQNGVACLFIRNRRHAHSSCLL